MLPLTNKSSVSTGDYNNGKSRRPQSVWRVWRRLSRLQRRVVILFLVVSAAGGFFVFRHFVPHGFSHQGDDQEADPLARINRIDSDDDGVLPVNHGQGMGDEDFIYKGEGKRQQGRPGKRGPPKGRREDIKQPDDGRGGRGGGGEVGDGGDEMPHLGIQVPPDVVKEGVRNEEEEEDDDDDGDGDIGEDGDSDSDVGAAAGAPGENDDKEVVLPLPDGNKKHDSNDLYGPKNERQQAVVDAFKHAWKAYKQYAWGHDELKPISRKWSEWFMLSLTMVDSLDTMIIMGLTEEFEEARNYIAEMSVAPNKDVNLFETTIRVLGSFLSTYHLTGDNMFLEKAVALADGLLKCFSSKSPIPYSDVNLMTGIAHAPRWGPDSSVSEVSTIQLEFRDLSFTTGDPKYKEAADKVMMHLHNLPKKSGLVPIFVNANSGQFRPNSVLTLGARADSYYEYLLKQWLQTGKSEEIFENDYLDAVRGITSKLVSQSEPNKLTFIGENQRDQFSPKMDELACFFPGTLALGYHNGLPESHLALAQEVAHTCYQMYAQMPTFLAPEITYFNTIPGMKEDLNIKPADTHNLLRPETIESFFYLHRITGENFYREWGWKIFEAFEKHTKVKGGGYTSIGNVKNPSQVNPRDKMESFFLGETLKYLFLLFSDNPDLISLDKFVFNTEAHPLPLRTPDGRVLQ